MLIDLFLKGQKTLVVGGGNVGERKTLQLLDAGAEVTVVSKEFTEKLIELSRAGEIKIEKIDVEKGLSATRIGFAPKVVIVSLDNQLLNRKVAKDAKANGALVCVVDDPAASDFAMPAVAKIGDIRVGVSTGGSSPAMAGVLRRRIEEMITESDVRMVELQKYARALAKQKIDSQEERSRVLRRIIDDTEVKKLLEKGLVDEAKRLAEKIITGAR
ncbi:MAG: bifunctional precorrin-2 dehydrogenase/sirohydrochlorin ferrochelatase [Thaumarchaeota archaeon]|nr:bifunctional precorrin-2 dehydrogenase/sirohydrochlorin ferrochelatase [Nitrososphaerota archaeon]